MLSRWALILFILIIIPLQVQAAPRVVVSIAPVQSLVAGVMEGVAEPELLVAGAGSPHTYMLKPSQRRALGQADLVVWVGESVESFLPKSLAMLDLQVVQLELMALPGINLLPTRRGGEWQQDSHGNHHHHHGHDSHQEKDGHLWLDPINARVIVKAVTERLVKLDGVNAERYQANATRLLRRLDAMNNELHKVLEPIKSRPYLVFHDAYQYLEARYGLNALGAISVDPDRKPGARRLKEIRHTIKHHNISCVFREPQFSNAAIHVVSEGRNIKSGVLDPMGSDLKSGPQMYFDMMYGLSDGLVDCLSQ